MYNKISIFVVYWYVLNDYWKKIILKKLIENEINFTNK